jgi:hypothetical protein
LPFKCNLQRYNAEERTRREKEAADQRKHLEREAADERKRLEVGLCTLESS